MNLLVDIGNSRIKWALQQQEMQSSALPHHQSDCIGQLSEAWWPLPAPKVLAISSVGKETLKTRLINLAKQLWGDIEIFIAQSEAEAFGVRNSYPKPEKLGVDRWLCLVAAHHHYPQAAWIVDCGTAITVDFIDDDGVHQGGLISPGLRLMKTSLLQNTAALEMVEDEHDTGLANHTEAAIFSGTLYAATGLVEQALKSRDAKAVLVLTGGDAELMAKHLPHSVIVEPDLVLKGLAVLIHEHL